MEVEKEYHNGSRCTPGTGIKKKTQTERKEGKRGWMMCEWEERGECVCVCKEKEEKERKEMKMGKKTKTKGWNRDEKKNGNETKIREYRSKRK